MNTPAQLSEFVIDKTDAFKTYTNSCRLRGRRPCTAEFCIISFHTVMEVGKILAGFRAPSQQLRIQSDDRS